MLGQREVLMNSFYEHHKDSIRWHYRCFDRILLNGIIQPFQQPERVVGFFNTYRQLYPVSRNTLPSLRYDLSKLRAKGLVAKLPNSRRYQLLPHRYSLCLIFRGANESWCSRSRRKTGAGRAVAGRPVASVA